MRGGERLFLDVKGVADVLVVKSAEQRRFSCGGVEMIISEFGASKSDATSFRVSLRGTFLAGDFSSSSLHNSPAGLKLPIFSSLRLKGFSGLCPGFFFH